MHQTKPIKRNEALQPVSREHHQGLLLCWKIRQGLKKNITPERMKTYADWFYKAYLLPHFEIEEKYLFPILGHEHELIIKATAQHRRLTRLFTDQTHLAKSLSFIEEELETHIRFEERVLFNLIQEAANARQLNALKKFHVEVPFVENETDQFWE